MGSSPLTRGKLGGREPHQHELGLIPAHAGKTSCAVRGSGHARAHPRSRGENAVTRPSPRLMEGSSPLTRGKRPRSSSGSASSGLIPAHAGKTTQAARSRSASWAHPRSRGENGTLDESAHTLTGSSPLTRGKRLSGSDDRLDLGLIPAHAGKTMQRGRTSTSARAHPRSRGENWCSACRSSRTWGSSPLTRGKRVYAVRGPLGEGLIPAHAGKTEVADVHGEGAWAHPRSRGENSRPRRLWRSWVGSSPLTRGKPVLDARFGGKLGLIPAHAGKTRRAGMTANPSGAHPRSRGENVLGTPTKPSDRGSSPLTRGKHLGGEPFLLEEGLIPAHAGKTR